MKRILLFTTFSILIGRAGNYDGKVFEKNSHQQNLLFKVSHKELITSDGHRIINRVFSDPNGKVVATEDILTKDGKTIKLTLSQKQLGEEGVLEVHDGKAFFTYTKDGKTSNDDEKATDNLVVSGTVVPYLQKNWPTILKGDEVGVRYAALDRKETVGFKFFKVEEKKMNGKDVIVVKMKPSSFIIAALVDPLFFTFTQDGSELLELVGRTLPKIQIDGKWKDLDADIMFTTLK